MRKILVIITMILITSCSSKYDQSFQELKKGNYAKSFNLCDGEKDDGCKYLTGFIYYKGLGVKRDIGRGLKLIKEAADNGFSSARIDLGNAYLNGIGVPQDYRKAIELYKKVMEQGVPVGFYNVAYMYVNGKGVPVDIEKGIDLYKKSLEKKYGDAAWTLGSIYLNDKFKVKDLKKAIHWLKKGEKLNNANSIALLADIYSSDEYSLKDNSKTFFYLKKAAELGHYRAQYNTGVYYIRGIGTNVDFKKGISWLEKSSKGLVSARVYLGNLYRYEKQIRDYKKSIFWYKSAANAGDSYAQRQLGVMYANGRGVPKDPKTGYEWMLLSAKQDDLDSLYLLSYMYEKGIGTEKNVKLALNILFKVAEKGHAPSQMKIADFYLYGVIFKKNEKEGLKWLEKAAKKNNKARYKLGLLLYKKKDYTRSRPLLEKAARLNDAKSQALIALMYFAGTSYQKNLVNAYAWINISLTNLPGDKDNLKLRSSIESKMDLSQIKKAQTRTRELIAKYKLLKQ